MREQPAFGFRRLARRPLPFDDPSVDALEPRERDALAAMWERRAAAELGTAAPFARIATELLELGAAPEVLAVASRAAGDEVRHAELCRRVAERYRGTPVAWPVPAKSALPGYRDLDAQSGAALRVLAMCAVGETIACGFLEACLAATMAPLPRATLRELLADEIDHARLGWAYLASPAIDAGARAALRPSVGPLLRAARTTWLRQNRAAISEGVPTHGLLSEASTAVAVEEAIASVVLPGLARVGLSPIEP